MGNWFDRLAKASAPPADGPPGSPAPDAGLTRRQVLARGAVVTGAAWSAPVLMSVQPAYAGASECVGSDIYTVCPNGTTYRCCPPGQVCLVDTTGALVCDVPAGGVCANQGQGQCNGGRSRCNQPSGNPAQNPSICGGAGTVCSDGSICSPTSPCSVGLPGSNGDNRCGGQGAPCTSDSQCAAKTVDQPATTCLNNICTAA